MKLSMSDPCLIVLRNDKVGSVDSDSGMYNPLTISAKNLCFLITD